jgi:hypothetical protein
MKFILRVYHKVNDFIEDSFKYETWLGSVHNEFRVNAVQFWDEYRYSGKAVAEDHPHATLQSPSLNRIRFSVSL